MAKSKIISDLILNQSDEEIGINRVMLIGLELESDKIIRWAESELHGYKSSEAIPFYRKYGLGIIKYSGICGNLKIDNASLQAEIIEQEYLNVIKGRCHISDGIRSIKQYASASDGVLSQDLSTFIGYVYKRSGIQCTSLTMQFPATVYSNALSGMKTTLIKALFASEKTFGSLDNFDIDYKAFDPPKIDAVTKEVISILYSDDTRY